MLFSEIYGSYFNVVAEVLAEAVKGELNAAKMNEIIRQKAFSESTLSIPDSLKSEAWPLIDKNMKTPIKHTPTMPLTLIEKRWLKALTLDPRIKLFEPDTAGLEDTEPLYTSENVVYFDRYTDGDPYDDEIYISNFQTVLKAFREKKKLLIKYSDRFTYAHTYDCIPYRLEYSPKDDKFRLVCVSRRKPIVMNMARIKSCSLYGEVSEGEYHRVKRKNRPLVFELTDERNALERIMLHFSDLEKKTQQLSDKLYRVTLTYDSDDETELLIRILSFGPLIKVLSPESFISLIRQRLNKQASLSNKR